MSVSRTPPHCEHIYKRICTHVHRWPECQILLHTRPTACAHGGGEEGEEDTWLDLVCASFSLDFTHTLTYVYNTHTYVYTYIYIPFYVFHTHTHVRIYIHIYTILCIYVYTYIYTYIKHFNSPIYVCLCVCVFFCQHVQYFVIVSSILFWVRLFTSDCAVWIVCICM